MTVQFLFIFVNKEQSKGQKKLNARQKKVGRKGGGMLSLNEKLEGGITFRRHELPRCGIHLCSVPGC